MMNPGRGDAHRGALCPNATSRSTIRPHYPVRSQRGGHGFVWHCHIIDHEDNEMMRPYKVTPKSGATRTYIQGADY